MITDKGTIIADNPPSDGKQYDCQCARCGSSVDFEPCGACGGDGQTQPGELYEEDPLWYDMDSTAPCHQCGGQGSFGGCMSSPEYCESHPLPGREAIKRDSIEWFEVRT